MAFLHSQKGREKPVDPICRVRAIVKIGLRDEPRNLAILQYRDRSVWAIIIPRPRIGAAIHL